MGMMIGNEVIDGVPYINGKKAVWDDKEPLDCFSNYRCPECNANLMKDGLICANACHLSMPAFQRFQAGILAAAARVEKKERFLKIMKGDEKLPSEKNNDRMVKF